MDMFLCNQILTNLKRYLDDVPTLERQLLNPLEELRAVVSIIREKLENAEDRLNRPEEVDSKLKQLGIALYEADDLVEEITHASFHRKAMFGNGVLRQVHRFFSPFNQLVFDYKMTKVVLDVGKKLNRIQDECFEVESSTRLGSQSGETHSSDASYGQEELCVGREEDKKKLVSMLLDSSVEENVSVISIVGMGGLGKTTLAKLVYNDPLVQAHFELRVWVHVSENFDMRDIARQIIQSATNKKPLQERDMSELETQLQGEINGKRYLLILDDVWERSNVKWVKLRKLLSGGARGSRILVTTRLMEVGIVTKTAAIYELLPLSDDSSWSLFKRVACIQESKDPELIEIGRGIVKQCANVPLAITTVGRLLRSKGKQRWLSFGGGTFGTSPQDHRTRIMDILMLSYNHLPTNLKPCLAFCSLYPKDYEFNSRDLISLWMAQGFIEAQDQSLEDAGEEYFHTLSQRCFFQDVNQDESNGITTCKMHDLIHDLVVAVAANYGFITSVLETNLSDNGARHLSFTCERNSIWEKSSSIIQARQIRTFLRPMKGAADFEPAKMICTESVSNLRCLRVLDLHDLGLKELPSSIANLHLLRYLDLSKNTCLMELPESITGLFHLQTLNLHCCENLKRLPKGIGKLVNLRRLEIDECDSLTGIPMGLGKLTCLQILSRFIVSKDGSDHHGGLEVLNSLNNLKGRLTIELSGESATALKEVAEANLASKTRLSELRIGWVCKRPGLGNGFWYEALLQGITSLSNLKVLDIDGCKECQHLPEFGQLPLLKRLTLRFMDDVQYVESRIQSSSSYKSLEELTLHGLYSLTAWWKQVGEEEQQSFPSFPRLRKLKIWNCPKLMVMPLFQQVEDLDLLHVDKKLLQDPSSTPPSTDAATSSTSRSLSRSPTMANSFENLPNLRSLHIRGCRNLRSFPTLAVSRESSYTSSLKYLVIDKCDDLRFLAEGLRHFSVLEKLEIRGCNELDFTTDSQEKDGLPWKSLSRLRQLTFHDLPKMEKLPGGLEHVSTLIFLTISSCSNLACLPEWISNLTSLQYLRIECCPALTMLPDKLTGLKSLEKVEITECPVLVEKCKEHTGEEWHKIKHASVLLHKSWRYRLLADAVPLQATQQNPRKLTEGTSYDATQEGNVLAQYKDAVVHVTGATVTVRKL